MLRRILKNVSVLTLATVLSRALSFYITIYLARAFGPDGFGKIALAQAIIVYFCMATDLGLKTYATREIAGQLAQSRTLLNRIFSLRVVLGLLSFAACQLAAPLFPVDAQTVTVVLRMSLLIVIAGATIDWIFYLKEEMEWIGLSDIVQNIVLLTLVYFWAKSRDDLYRIPIAFVISSFCALIVTIWVLKRRDRLPSFDMNLTAFLAILKQAFPIGLSVALITLYNNLAQIMLGFMQDTRAAGLYAAANKFVSFGILGLNILLAAFYPAFVQLYKNQPQTYFMSINLGSRFLLPIGFGLGALLAPLSDDLILFLYGEAFAETGPVLSLLIWGLAITTLRMFYDNYLILAGKQTRYLQLIFIYFLSFLVMNAIFISAFGMLGAALATVLAEIILTASEAILLPKDFFKNYYSAFTGALLAGAALYLLKTLKVNSGLVLAASGMLFIGWMFHVVREDYPKWRQIRLALRPTS